MRAQGASEGSPVAVIVPQMGPHQFRTMGLVAAQVAIVLLRARNASMFVEWYPQILNTRFAFENQSKYQLAISRPSI